MLNKKQVERAFGAQLRKLALERGFDEKKLAELSGMHFHSTWSYLWGGGNPQLYSVYKLATALNVPVTELVGVLDE